MTGDPDPVTLAERQRADLAREERWQRDDALHARRNERIVLSPRDAYDVEQALMAAAHRRDDEAGIRLASLAIAIGYALAHCASEDGTVVIEVRGLGGGR